MWCLSPARIRASILICIFAALTVRAIAAESQTVIGDGLRAAIRRWNPTARVLERKDLDAQECESIPPLPGLVKADFNGDGRADFAALLKVGDVKEIKKAAGKTWEIVELAFVIFLGDAGGSFRAIVLDRSDQGFPYFSYIQLQRPGIVREWAETEIYRRKIVRLKNAGILRVACGKAAEVLYWDAKENKFRTVIVSD